MSNTDERMFNSPTLNRFDNLTTLITSERKSRCVRVYLHSSPEGLLSSRSHRIRLVQDDNLVFARWESHLFLSKHLDLVSDNIDTSLVGGVQLQDGFFVRWSEKSAC